MKRAVILSISIILLFCGCSTKTYSPEIPASFENEAEVTSGDFSYKCKICRNEEKTISIDILSTKAKGLYFSYDGKILSFKNNSLTYSIENKNLDSSNIAILLYEAFNCIESTENSQASKTENGFKYKGMTSLGEFTLYQNDDNSYRTLIFPDNDIKISFKSE